MQFPDLSRLAQTSTPTSTPSPLESLPLLSKLQVNVDNSKSSYLAFLDKEKRFMYMNLDSQWATVSDENYPEKYKQLKGHPKEIDVYDILNFIETKIAAEITNNNSAANNMRLETYKLYLEHGNIIANDTYEAHKQEKARQQEEAHQQEEARNKVPQPKTIRPRKE